MLKWLNLGFIVIGIAIIASLFLIISPNSNLRGKNQEKKEIKKEKRLAPAPSVVTVWSENFNNGCSANCLADTWNGWSIQNNVDGTSGGGSNNWYISCAEEGVLPPGCGSSCVGDASLHIGNDAGSGGDVGAGFNETGATNATFKLVVSPTINLTGYSGNTLAFDFIAYGSASCSDDRAQLRLSTDNGATWPVGYQYCLTSVCCGACNGYSQGQWTVYTIALPPAFDNNPNVRVAFHWRNNGNGSGTDPSIAVDDIRITNNTLLAFRTKGTGVATFASLNHWESSLDGTTWIDATTAPTSADSDITIRSGHTAIINANISLDQITVQNGGTLQVNTGVTLTIADGTGTDLAINNGGMLDVQGTGTLGGAGSFTLDAGATFRTANTTGFNAIGLSGTETFTAGANYNFNGNTLQTINNPTGISANNFTINNSAGGKLTNPITITGTLTLTSGDLDLNGFNLTLNGTLAEDRANNHLVKDLTATSDASQGGGIIFSGNVTNISTEIAGTGLYLQRTSGADYGITVTRKHYKGATNSRGGTGIGRIYKITGSPTGTNTTMRIYYATDETAGVVGTYRLFRWQLATGWKQATDAGSGFANGTNGAGVYVEATGINGFSDWTVGASETPLPINLVKFEAERIKSEEVKLTWTTATEINNKGFVVETSQDGLAYQKIAFIEGKGNSTTVQSYSHTTIQPDDSYYRLKQIDFDGTFTYSPIVFVEGVAGKVIIYPNPSNGAFTILVGKDKLDSPARLLNAQGQEVWRGVQTEVRTTDLPAGVYFLHTTVAGKTKITKVVIER